MTTYILISMILQYDECPICDGYEHEIEGTEVSDTFSSLFKVLEHDRILDFQWKRTHAILVDSLRHDPQPRQRDRPAHFWLVSSCFQRISPNDPKTHIHLVVHEIRIEHGGHVSNSKHWCVATRGIDTIDLGFWSNDAGCQVLLSLKDANLTRIERGPIDTAPIVKNCGWFLLVGSGHLIECIVVATTILAVAYQPQDRRGINRELDEAALALNCLAKRFHRCCLRV